MMDVKLYMLLLGCKPRGRHTEQHDVFFGIGSSLKSLVPDILDFWPEAEGRVHIDAWREVTAVNGYSIGVRSRLERPEGDPSLRLFFINLGGYKANDFEEYHYRCLAVAPDTSGAVGQAKDQTFWKHRIDSHVDDKYGIDVDDIYEINDILAPRAKAQYELVITPGSAMSTDKLYPGYLQLNQLR